MGMTLGSLQFMLFDIPVFLRVFCLRTARNQRNWDGKKGENTVGENCAKP
jgi:hypothetical protein